MAVLAAWNRVIRCTHQLAMVCTFMYKSASPCIEEEASSSDYNICPPSLRVVCCVNDPTKPCPPFTMVAIVGS